MSCCSRLVLTAAISSSLTLSAHAQQQLSTSSVSYVEPSVFGVSTGSGARALGMGGAFIAIADDATAASWNPAGLAILEKPEASLVYAPSVRYRTDFASTAYTSGGKAGYGICDPSCRTIYETTYSSVVTYQPYVLSQESRFIDFGSLTVPLRFGKRWKLVPQVNYQRVIDFGFDGRADQKITDVDTVNITPGAPPQMTKTWSGQASQNVTSDSTGGLDAIVGSLGVSFSQEFQAGVSVAFYRGGRTSTGRYANSSSGYSYTLVDGTTRSYTDPAPKEYGTDLNLSDRYSGVGVTIGMLLKPSRKIAVGFVFKPPFQMKYTRDQTEKYASPYNTATDTYSRNVDRHSEGTIDWPTTVGAGVGLFPTEALTVSLDYTQSRWSQTRYFAETEAYKRVTVCSYCNPRTDTYQSEDTSRYTFPTMAYASGSGKESPGSPYQSNSWQLRAGAEYVFRKPGFLGLTALPVRGGVYLDRQIAKDDLTLDPVTYNGYSAGLGLVWSRLSLDMAYVRNSGEAHVGDSGQDSSTSKTRSSGPSKTTVDRFYTSVIVRF